MGLPSHKSLTFTLNRTQPGFPLKMRAVSSPNRPNCHYIRYIRTVYSFSIKSWSPNNNARASSLALPEFLSLSRRVLRLRKARQRWALLRTGRRDLDVVFIGVIFRLTSRCT